VDARRQVYRQAQDTEQASVTQTDSAAQEAKRFMHRPLHEQHSWYASVLRGHYGYFGMPHNWRSLNGFLQDIRRVWFNCLKRRSQKNRRMGWDWFEAVTACLPLPQPRITHPWAP
jgi:RNA-directed DNA polymerase